MQRSPDLRALSREHHHALVLARRAVQAASRGSDQDVIATWSHIRTAFRQELAPHFAVEEVYLLPALVAAGAVELATRTRRDHDTLRFLAAADDDPRARLAEFGVMLRQHVRFEERHLFPAAEAVLEPIRLAVVAHASERSDLT